MPKLLRPEKVRRLILGRGTGGILVSRRVGSAGKGADLDQVVAEYPVPAPDGSSLAAVQPGAVPAVSALEVADPAFAAGSPLDQLAEAAGVLDGAAGGGGLAFARDGDRVYPEDLQVPLGC